MRQAARGCRKLAKQHQPEFDNYGCRLGDGIDGFEAVEQIRKSVVATRICITPIEDSWITGKRGDRFRSQYFPTETNHKPTTLAFFDISFLAGKGRAKALSQHYGCR